MVLENHVTVPAISTRAMTRRTAPPITIPEPLDELGAAGTGGGLGEGDRTGAVGGGGGDGGGGGANGGEGGKMGKPVPTAYVEQEAPAATVVALLAPR